PPAGVAAVRIRAGRCRSGGAVGGEALDEPQALEPLVDPGAGVVPRRAHVATGGGDELGRGECRGELGGLGEDRFHGGGWIGTTARAPRRIAARRSRPSTAPLQYAVRR